jgi:hypothetical protein
VAAAAAPGRDQRADRVGGGDEHERQPGDDGQDVDDPDGVHLPAARFGGPSNFVNVPHFGDDLG